MTHRIIVAGLSVAAAMLPALAQAQPADYPSRPLRLVVPYAPGGIADLLGRVVAQPLGAMYGRALVVENRSGSGGHIGADAVVNAPADGYTLMLATISHNAAYSM